MEYIQIYPMFNMYVPITSLPPLSHACAAG